MEAINVRSLLNDPEQVITVKEQLELTDVAHGGQRIPLLAPVTVEGAVTAIGSGILRFDGTASTKAKMNCDRCNAEVEVPFRADVSQRFAKDPETEKARGGKNRAGAESLSLEELDAEPITAADRIDLEDIILYEIQLSIPMKVLCKQDCKGLCPECGRNLNEGSCSCKTKETDPRWDALKGLFSDDEPSDGEAEK